MRKKTGKRSWIFQVGPDPGHSRTMYLLILGEKNIKIKFLDFVYVFLSLKTEPSFSLQKCCEVTPVPQIISVFCFHVFFSWWNSAWSPHVCKSQLDQSLQPVVFLEEMDSADPEAKSESESIPIWPDTDDEEQSSMNFATYRKNTEGSTLEGVSVFLICWRVQRL